MQIIKKRVGLTVSILGLLIIVLILLNTCNRIKTKVIVDQAITQSDKVERKQIDLQDVKIWKDKYNNEHLKLEVIKVQKIVMEHYADSLARLLKIKPKQIQSVANVKSSVELKEKLVVDTVYVDSTKSYSTFKWSDKWISIKGDIGNTDSISIVGIDTLTKIDYWKRNWILGKKRYYTDISNQNPHIKLTGFKSVEVIGKKEKRLGIGPYIGLQFNGTTISPSLGVALSYQLIKL